MGDTVDVLTAGEYVPAWKGDRHCDRMEISEVDF
jgi:hypothetical protein